jgi:DNA-binding response OmpR family regulator
MSSVKSLLVVDDDPTVRDFLQDYLTEHGYHVDCAADGEALRARLAERVPDVVLLDVGLPGEDGLSLARYVREHFDIGIIMVSGAGEPLDRIVGLEVGADDYISKPFEPRELRARLKSILYRYPRHGSADNRNGPGVGAPARVRFGACTLDLDTRQLFNDDGQEIPLTSMEFDLLKVFAERPNRPLSRDQLMNLTRHRDCEPYDRSIDIRIARLRHKIKSGGNGGRIIKTLRGIGYVFVPTPG